MPGFPDVAVYTERIDVLLGGRTLLGIDLRAVLAARGGARAGRVQRPGARRHAAHGQAHRVRLRRGALRCAAPDDRRPAAVATAGPQGPDKTTLASFVFENGTAWSQELDRILAAQIRQTQADAVEVLVVPDACHTERQRQRLRQWFGELLGTGTSLDLRHGCDQDLDRDASGKLRPVVGMLTPPALEVREGAGRRGGRCVL